VKDEPQPGPPNWVLKNLPLILCCVTGVAWGARLEERMASHLKLPFHEGMRQTREALIEIKAEVRYMRLDLQELKETLNTNRE